MLSLLEMYVITKGQYWYLLMSSVIRLGPMVILSSLWIFYSNSYDSHLLVGSICLTFQAIKGICLLIASIDGINKKTKAKNRQIKHHYQKPASTEKPFVEESIISNDREEVLIVPTISFQHISNETPKKILDPIKPAYNICGGLEPIKE